MTLTILHSWLIAGVLLLLAEALGISGVGLMFAGAGAFTVGALISVGVFAEDALILQFTAFFLATALWASFLWKPLQKFRVGAHKQGYSNMVGDTAYVGSNGVSKNQDGEVTWSGTIMKARLDTHAPVDHLEAGAEVEIVSIKGVTLTVKPKH